MRFKKRSEGADVSGAEKPGEERPAKNSRKMELNVILYTVILFVAALALILLSYAIQQRAGAPDPESPGQYEAAGADIPDGIDFTIETPAGEDGGTQP